MSGLPVLAKILESGPARIDIASRFIIDETLADPHWACWWVPTRAAKRLLIASEPKSSLLVFSDAGEGGSWQGVPVAVLAEAGFVPERLNQALAGAVLEASLAGDPGGLYPFDLLRYGAIDMRDWPLSERLALLRQTLAQIHIPGRWFKSLALTGSPRVLPCGQRPSCDLWCGIWRARIPAGNAPPNG